MRGTAAIVGGGIGGLAAAIGLSRAGWSVTVLERMPDLPQAGTALGIWPSALRALDQLGVGATVRARGRPQPNGAVRRPDGSVIGRIDVDRLRRRDGEPVYLLSRPALLGVLADALPSGALRFGAPVTDPGSLVEAFDVVIGADGIGSAVREALFASPGQLRYAGVTTWRGTVELDLSAGSETWGKGRKFGLTPQTDGRANWYAVRTAPEGYQPPGGHLAELRRLFGDWHQPIPRLLDRIDPEAVLHHDLRYLAPLPAYTEGNVALIGDAAHAMTPDLGQGACQAIIDAVALADALATAPDVPTALTRYDRQRRAPTQRMAAMALRVNRLSQIRRFTPLRDLAVKAALAFGPPG